jgi:hypothetical protein
MRITWYRTSAFSMSFNLSRRLHVVQGILCLLPDCLFCSTPDRFYLTAPPSPSMRSPQTRGTYDAHLRRAAGAAGAGGAARRPCAGALMRAGRARRWPCAPRCPSTRRRSFWCAAPPACLQPVAPRARGRLRGAAWQRRARQATDALWRAGQPTHGLGCVPGPAAAPPRQACLCVAANVECAGRCR